MRRTEQVQGLRLMKFEEVYGRSHRGGLSQAEAAEVLGVSERTCQSALNIDPLWACNVDPFGDARRRSYR